MSYEMIAIIGKMLCTCRDIRRLEKISTGTAADIIHGFASEISHQLSEEGKIKNVEAYAIGRVTEEGR